jgi:hypothetical protein
MTINQVINSSDKLPARVAVWIPIITTRFATDIGLLPVITLGT